MVDKMNKMYWGIDLGTSNSVLAVKQPDRDAVAVQGTGCSLYVIPSIVYFDAT